MIELLIAVFIVGTVMIGLFGLFVLSLRSAQEGERRVVAIALANERMEMIRNLPYQQVGTAGGAPSGSILPAEVVQRNSLSYTVTTDIRYIDDPFDGVAGGTPGQNCVAICHRPPGNPGGQTTLCVPQSAVDAHLAHGDTTGPCQGQPSPGPDLLNTDYKQARVHVSWNSPNQIKPVLLVSNIAPVGIEEGEVAGTLDFQALDAQGAGVVGATVTLTNTSVQPNIDITTTTNDEGRVVLPGLPESSGTYKLTVTKANYTSEQTYDTTASFVPDPDYQHLSMIAGQVTGKTFLIDRVSTVTIETEDEQKKKAKDIAYTLRGTKTIGLDGSQQPVYRLSVTDSTGPSGKQTHTGIVWDAYELTISGVTTGYDIKETSVILPATIDPATTTTITTTLVPHTPISLHVTVANPGNQPVDNATVSLASGAYQATLGTGTVGQVLFPDLPSNGSYTINVSAPGYQAYAGSVDVTDSTRTRVTVAPT